MNYNPKTQRIIFDLPEDQSSTAIIDAILQENHLEESDDEYFDKILENNDTASSILNTTAKILFEKKIPEERLAGFLASHLEIPAETAAKIIVELKEKLVPYAKVITPMTEEELRAEQQKEAEKEVAVESEEEISTQDALIEKLKQTIPDEESAPEETDKPDNSVKEISTSDVDKNAANLKQQRSATAQPGTAGESLQRKSQPDKYREAIEE